MHHLLAAPAVAGDEDLVVDDTETAARLGWKAQGTVLDASVLTIGTSEPGVEVFRSPTVFLATDRKRRRLLGPGEPVARAVDRPTAPEIAVLESARATSGDGSLVTGSVSALAALRSSGTDAELRRRALLPPTGVQVAATFGTGEPGLQITIKWSDLVAAAGNSSRHSRLGTWTLRFEPAVPLGRPPHGRARWCRWRRPIRRTPRHSAPATPGSGDARHDVRMKRVSHTLTYPGTTVDEVFAMFGDPAYRTAVSEYQQVVDFGCDITATGTGMDVRVEQAHGTDRIPGFAQRLVGQEIRFVQKEAWSSPGAADIHVTIPGKPGDIIGTETLEQSGGDVVQTIELAVKVSMPLVGGKLEDLIAGFVGRVFDAENKVGVKWLAGEWRSDA